jgi:hypothetical protein
MDRVKAIVGILLITMTLCSFVELFNKNNTEEIIWFLIGTMYASAILSTLIIKSIKR